MLGGKRNISESGQDRSRWPKRLKSSASNGPYATLTPGVPRQKSSDHISNFAPPAPDRGLFPPPIRMQNYGRSFCPAGEELVAGSPEWRDICPERELQPELGKVTSTNDLTPIEIESTLDRIRFDVRRKWENQR
jgi:hypothetical protein